jgi:hypothetical protein
LDLAIASFFLSRGALYTQQKTSYNSNIFFSTRFLKCHYVTCFVLLELLLCRHTPHQWLDTAIISFFISRDTLYTQEKTSYKSNIFCICLHRPPVYWHTTKKWQHVIASNDSKWECSIVSTEKTVLIEHTILKITLYP